jgi:molybdopterin synthase catalytic subunit
MESDIGIITGKEKCMKNKEFQDIFVSGPLSTERIQPIIAQLGTDNLTGASAIFLGQVRADLMDDSRVKAIDFTAFREMAYIKYQEIREALFRQYSIGSLHVYHSLGLIPVGEICFFVAVSAVHSPEAIRACEDTVKRIKSEMPIWGKIWKENNTYFWKTNLDYTLHDQ